MSKYVYAFCLLVATAHLMWLALDSGRVFNLTATSQSGILQVDANELDLGTIWATTHFGHQLTIRNCSDQTVSVKEFRASCNCTTIEPSSATIAPREECRLSLVLDLSKNPHPASSSSPFTVLIDPVLDNASSRIEPWELTCNVRYPFKVDRAAIQFPDESIIVNAEYPEEHVRVHVNPSLDGASWHPRDPSGKVTCRVHLVETLPRTFDLVLKPNKELPIGYFHSTVELVLADSAVADEEIVALKIPVIGEMYGEIAATPQTLHFSNTAIGELKEQTVVFLARSGGNLQFVQSDSDSKNVDVSVLPSSRPDIVPVLFRASPTSPGATRESMSLVFSIGNEQTMAESRIDYQVVIATTEAK